MLRSHRAEVIAQNFLAGKPTGILAYSRQSFYLEVIAWKLLMQDPSKSFEQHLTSIYDYILEKCPTVHLCNEDERLETIVPEKIMQNWETLIEESRECFTETFIAYFRKQLKYFLNNAKAGYAMEWLSEEYLLKAFCHISVHNCQRCRFAFSNQIKSKAWNKHLDHDFFQPWSLVN